MTRRLRSLIIALAVLALSAGLVAGREMPEAAADGLATAAEAAGKIVPVGPPAPTEGAPVEDVEEDEPGDEVTEPAEEVVEPVVVMNHGSVVSEAAKAETPEGFRNHGAYVSSVAKGDDGKPESAGPKSEAGQTKGKSAEAKGKTKGGSGN